MSPKYLASLAVIAAALIAFVVLSKPGDAEKRVMSAGATRIEGTTFFKGVNPADITRITIERKDKAPIELRREMENDWSVLTRDGHRPVEDYLLKGLPGGATDPKEDEFRADIPATVVAEKAASQAGLKTDDAQAVKVAFIGKDDKVLETLLIGGRSRDPVGTSFVRRPGSDISYRLGVDLGDNFNPERALDWRRKTVWSGLATEMVNHVKVDAPQTTRTFELRRTSPKGAAEATWEMSTPAGPREVDPSRVHNMVQALTLARAMTFVEELESEKPDDFTAGTTTVAISADDRDTSFILTLGRSSTERNGQVFARTNQSADVFLMFPEFNVENGWGGLVKATGTGSAAQDLSTLPPEVRAAVEKAQQERAAGAAPQPTPASPAATAGEAPPTAPPPSATPGS